jgi:N-acetylmuramoyl-L-alanine amidase
MRCLIAASIAIAAVAAEGSAQRASGVAARPGAATSKATTTARASTPRESRRRTVIVDAGHGGVDRGMSGRTTSGRRIYEKDVTLAVARLLADRLEKAGVRVVMTRTADTLIGLYDRGPIANAAEGDLFISVHVNAANPNWKDPSGARGFETYFLAEAKTEDERRVAAMENEAVQFESAAGLPKRDDALGFMMNDLLQNEHLRESSDLATTVQQRMKTIHPGPSRGVKQGGLVVLIKAFMPAVLVEIGFGSNPAEADWMTSAAGQAEIADAISQAAVDYLARYERRVSGGTGGK